jgi:AcrR family transcriptional regulator
MRKSILYAFERLLQKSSYCEIGVNKICAEAHISKPTFYRYFQSKENIVSWLSQEAIRCGIAEVGRKYTWTEGYFRTLTVLGRYKVFYSDPKGPVAVDPHITFCSEYFKAALLETLATYKKITLTKKLGFQVDAFIQMQSQLFTQWGLSDQTLSTKIYAEYLASVVPHDLYLALADPADFT